MVSQAKPQAINAHASALEDGAVVSRSESLSLTTCINLASLSSMKVARYTTKVRGLLAAYSLSNDRSSRNMIGVVHRDRTKGMSYSFERTNVVGRSSGVLYNV